MKKLNFAALAKAMERLDDSDDGMGGRCGNWELRLGGYDTGYEIYFRGEPIGRVNYEFKEYELYDGDFISKEQIPEFLAAIDARRFNDVGEHDEEEFEDDEEPIMNESRKKIMWAINFRNMHTAVHGLFYGKDRKRVEKFADRLEVINCDDELEWDEQYMAMEELYESFPDIATLDEFNYRDIVDLPGGYEGIEDDDTIYRFVNRVSMDIYEESTGKRKVVKEGWCPGYKWAEMEDAVELTLEIRNRRELDELHSLLTQARAKWDDAQRWIDKLDAFYDSGERNWGLELKGKKELDTLYALIRAGALSFDDKVAVKWRKRLLKLYDEMDAQVEELKGDERFLDVSRKAVKESTADNDGVPRIYVGTYAKYNDGSLDGKWIDLPDYNTYEEFVAACRELHSDEKDPEFMVQDYENFPEKWYHEGGLPTEEEFAKINEFYLMDDDERAAYEAFVNYTDDDDLDHFREAYQGKFDSPQDFAYDFVEGIGWDGVGQDNIDRYFDYAAFGRELMYDYHIGDPDNTDAEGNPEDPDHYYDNDGYDMGEYESDTKVAEDYIDSLGGVEQLGKETAQRYFDYDEFGRELLINDYFEEDGYIFSRFYG